MITWPLTPNWLDPYVETYSYLTEIIASEDGHEQRRAYRGAARRSVSYQALASRAGFQTLRGLLRRHWEAVTFPDERTYVRLSAGVAAASSSATIASPPVWIAVGRKVIFEHPTTGARLVRQISSVVGTTVGFTAAAPAAWPARTKIMPAFVGTMGTPLRSSMVTNADAKVDVRLDMEPGSEIEDVGAAVTLFNGLEVLTLAPNWTQSPTVESSDPTQWNDDDMGVRVGRRLIDFLSQSIQAKYLLNGAAALNDILGLFQRCKGRRGEFYVPSGFADITLAATVANGTKDWRIAGSEFYDAFYGDMVHRAVQVTLRTGAVLRFNVSTILTGSDAGGAYSTLRMVEAAPYAITPAQVATISWMPRCRFAADELTLTWITDQVAETLITYQTLEDLPA